nr:MAG TPA: Csm1 subunit domain B [Caudoviricetes sp.]
MSSKYSNRKNINYFIVKVGRPGKRLSGRLFYVHILCYVVCKQILSFSK